MARKWRVVLLKGIDTPMHTIMAHYSKEGLLPKMKRRLRIKVLYDGFIFFTFKEKLLMFTWHFFLLILVNEKCLHLTLHKIPLFHLCELLWKRTISAEFRASTPNFPNISYPLIRTRMYAYQGVRNARFSENLACLLWSLRKLSVSTKLPHQEIRWNYGVLCSVTVIRRLLSSTRAFTS